MYISWVSAQRVTQQQSPYLIYCWVTHASRANPTNKTQPSQKHAKACYTPALGSITLKRIV